MTPSKLKTNQEVVVQKVVAVQINGMKNKIEGLEAMIKILIKQ